MFGNNFSDDEAYVEKICEDIKENGYTTDVFSA
jgi:hypothetical protein